jgi:DNA-binding transcriptional LysR family regulator
MELTPAGRVFLDHACVSLLQVNVASEAARRAAQPAKTSFIGGFLAGCEIEWLPRIMEALSGELRSTELAIHGAPSPELVQALTYSGEYRRIDAGRSVSASGAGPVRVKQRRDPHRRRKCSATSPAKVFRPGSR